LYIEKKSQKVRKKNSPCNIDSFVKGSSLILQRQLHKFIKANGAKDEELYRKALDVF